MIEAERMNGADVKIDVIAGLDMVAKSRLNLVHAGIRVCNASNGAGSLSDGVDGSRELGNYHPRLAATGARVQHQVFTAANCFPLLFSQLHCVVSHSAASAMY